MPLSGDTKIAPLGDTKLTPPPTLLSISLGATDGLFPCSRVGTSVRDAQRRWAALRRRLDGTTRSVL
jgi:hypothetical protein